LLSVKCSKAADKLVAENVKVDDRVGQEPFNAYWHAMSDGTDNQPNKLKAMALWQARVDAGKNSCNEEIIGQAIHAIQDYFAPAHRGFKPWRNRWWEYLKHIGDGNDNLESRMAENATAALLSGIAGRCQCLCK